MTDKERIRNYIEELHNSHRGGSGNWYFRQALRMVLSFIDDMDKEYIDNVNIKKEV